MQPQRETMTDSLADIIQIVSLGNRNGTLTVERGEGKALEEGFITFVSGRVVEARTGHLSGAGAFNYLNAWRKCRFSFVNDQPTSYAFPLLPSEKQSIITDNEPANGITGTAVNPRRQENEIHKYSGRDGSPPVLPVRSQLGEAALLNPETAQLSRIHRRLLLLVNGQRSTHELARLIVRNVEEVQTLLNDLERVGYIKK